LGWCKTIHKYWGITFAEATPGAQADDCINLGDERSGNFAVHDITSAEKAKNCIHSDIVARKLVGGVVDDDFSRIRMIFLIYIYIYYIYNIYNIIYIYIYYIYNIIYIYNWVGPKSTIIRHVRSMSMTAPSGWTQNCIWNCPRVAAQNGCFLKWGISTSSKSLDHDLVLKPLVLGIPHIKNHPNTTATKTVGERAVSPARKKLAFT